jgi:hypothetical protein
MDSQVLLQIHLIYTQQAKKIARVRTIFRSKIHGGKT